MPDIFDELDAPAKTKDIFDELDETPAGRRDIFDELDDATANTPSLSLRPVFDTPQFAQTMAPKSAPEDTLLGKDFNVIESTSDWLKPKGPEIKPQGAFSRLVEETGQAPIRVARMVKDESGKWKPEAGTVDVITGDELNPRYSKALSVPIPTDYLTQAFPEGKLKDLSMGARNAVGSFVNFFLSPQGVSMLGIAGLPPAAQRSAATYFAYDMATHAPESLQAGDDAFRKGDMAGAAEGWAAGLGSLLMAGGAGSHAARGGPRPAPTSQAGLVRELGRQLREEPVLGESPVQISPRTAPTEEFIPRGEPIAQAELTNELMNRATEGATAPYGRIRQERFELPLAELRGQELIPIRESVTPEFRPGGGEAVGGKVSFMRGAEDVMPGRTWREDLNSWADRVLDENPMTKTRMGLDPVAEARRISAVAAKGLLLIEKGLTQFKDWSVEMVRQFGDSIQPHLQRIWEQSNSIKKGDFNALVPEAAQSARPLRQEPVEGKGEMPGESIGGKADVRRGEEVGGKAEAEIAKPTIEPLKGERLVELVHPDGKVEVVAFGDKVYDLTAMGKGKMASIARQSGDSWSHGMAPPGSTIREIGAAPKPEAPKPSTTTPESIAKEYGLEFRGEVGPGKVKVWQFHDPVTGSAVGVKAGSTPEAISAKIQQARESFKSEASAEPRQGTSPQEPSLSVGEQKSLAETPAAPKPLEVESVTPLDPQSGSPISNIQKILEKADTRLAEIQNQIRKGFYKGHTAMGVPAAILDTAIQAARLALKAGKPVAEAIEAALKHIRYNVQKFNEAEVRKTLERELAEASRAAGSGDVRSAPQIAGGEERMRKSAARATTSPQVPKEVQERIAEAPESFYESQKYKSVEEAVAAATDAELAAVPKNSNFHVASQLELSRRLLAEGKLDEGYEVFKRVSQQGTEWGQNINQFKMLKGVTPANVIDLVNRGLKESGRDPLTKKQMEELAKTSDDSIQANRELERAKADWKKAPTDENAARAQKALEKAEAADLVNQRNINRFRIKTWPQMLKTFAQGNPLTPISHVANFVGNTVGATMEGGSRGIASIVDAVRSAIASNPRLISANPKGAVESAKGFGRGLQKAPGILAKGSSDVVKGEVRAGLQPLRALAKSFAKNPDVPTVGGKVPLNERIRLLTEGTFGIAPEAMLRLLSVADKPAYEAARARLIAEQARLKGVPKSQMAMAQKFPELFFEKDILKQIKEESADAIFQRPSKAVNYLQNLIREKGGDWGDLAFTLMVSPYKLTPWNLVVRTLQYNPLIAAAKTALEASRGNTRAAEISAGRMVLGTILYGAGYYLYQNGLIGPSLDTKDEAQKARLLSGEVLPPNHVNVSGLQRALKGESPDYKPGDETVDLTRGGGAAGAILTSVANIGRRAEKQPEDGSSEMLASLARGGLLEQANFTINQSFLKGVTGLLDAIQHGNIGPYVTGVENMLLNVGTPNTLTALSRAAREYAPDMKADSVREEFGNVVRNRFGILGADDYMATKRDLFGEPLRQTPEGRNALLYQLFDISKNQQVTDDPLKLEMYRLWRKTADSKVIPSLPSREITVNNQTYPIPTPIYGEFAEQVGRKRKEVADEMMKNPFFNAGSDEVKIKMLDEVWRRGLDYGKERFWEKHGAELKPVAGKAGFRK